MISANTYIPIPARLVEIIDETPTIKTFNVVPERPLNFKAGQFVQLTLPGVGEAPFTPSSSPLNPEQLSITIVNTGTVTQRLHECSVNQMLGLRGPFGKGYPIENTRDKDVLVVGGGCGLAPLRSLILSLLENLNAIQRLSIKYGAKCMEELLYRDEYERWSRWNKVDFDCTIDQPQEGWSGKTGVVTTLLRGLDIDKKNCLVFVCGPSIMLKFVTLTLTEEGISPDDVYLSMNRRMSCGMGLCGRCNIGPYYLCKDGPDMNYGKIKDYPNVF